MKIKKPFPKQGIVEIPFDSFSSSGSSWFQIFIIIIYLTELNTNNEPASH